MIDSDDILYESNAFQKYRIRKENNETLNIQDVTRDEMFNMFSIHTDNEIAELFDVTNAVVKYRRYKLGATLRNIMLQQVEDVGYVYEAEALRNIWR